MADEPTTIRAVVGSIAGLLLLTSVFCLVTCAYFRIKSMLYMKPTASVWRALGNPTYLTEVGQRLYGRAVLMAVVGGISMFLAIVLLSIVLN